MVFPYLAVPAAFLLSTAIIFWMLKIPSAHLVLDQPNERSLHTVPVPRTGGIGLMAGAIAGWLIAWQPWMLSLLAGVAVLMAISFLDDAKGLSVRWRFLAHFFAAGLFIQWGLSAEPIWFLLIVLLGIVWMTNLYNFMDGSDGLAGGMALFGFSAYGVCALTSGDTAFAMANFIIAASAAGFLVFNFHPAKIFMGDAGSIPLGFLAAALGLVGVDREIWPLWFPVLVFSPFVIDATVTLFRRLLRGEKIWQAHRSHFYQQLVQLGWGHRKTALYEYGLMALAGVSGWYLSYAPLSVAICGLGVWVLLYLWLAVKINQMWTEAA